MRNREGWKCSGEVREEIGSPQKKDGSLGEIGEEPASSQKKDCSVCGKSLGRCPLDANLQLPDQARISLHRCCSECKRADVGFRV